MTDLLEQVRAFNRTHKLEAGLQTRVLDVCSEGGELAKLAFEESKCTPETDEQHFQNAVNWTEELGDTLYSLLSLCALRKVDPTQAVQNSLQKYKSRIRSKGTPSSKQ